MRAKTTMGTVPLTLRQANEYVQAYHRHHGPVRGHKFSIGCMVDGVLAGVLIAGRPVARGADDGRTLEVNRLCTDGAENACSFLYSRAARIAREMGYLKIITYILDSETGASLKAAGWHKESDVRGREWSCPSRHRSASGLVCDKQRWARELGAGVSL